MTEHTYTVKGLKELSTHDGSAFTVRLYRDDKCVGSVENAGTGGPNSYDVDDDVLAELVALAEATDPEAIGYDDAADLFVETLLEAYELTRHLNRQSAAKVLFMLDGDTPESARYLTTGKTTAAVMERALAQLRRRYPDQPVRVYFRGIEAWGLI